MKSNTSQFSIETRIFADEMESALQIPKGPQLFWQRDSKFSQISGGEIRILRRWNSHTPAMLDVWGGGYFIRWQGRGTIVDPGCSFVRLFQSSTNYGLDDVDMIIATHDHIDHCQDLGTLISLFREYNRWRVKRNHPPRTLDLLMSYGVADQYNSLLVHPDNAPFLRWGKVSAPRAVEQISPPPGLARNRKRKDMKGWKGYHIEYSQFRRRRIRTDYKYDLDVLRAEHKELLGEHTSMGLRFKLNNGSKGSKVLVISGDTGLTCSREEIAERYGGADILILHVGTMEKNPGQKRLDEHLGLGGVVAILEVVGQLRKKPELVVLTEWGYEFGRLGLFGRSRFTKLVEKELSRKGCGIYFVAILGGEPKGNQRIPIIPADIGLRISLPELQVWSGDSKQFVPSTDIRAEEKIEQIIFHSVSSVNNKE